MSDQDVSVDRLNVRAIIGLLVSVGVAVVGLFLLPVLRGFGLGFSVSFWSLLALEFVAFLGVAYSVLHLHREQRFD